MSADTLRMVYETAWTEDHHQSSRLATGGTTAAIAAQIAGLAGDPTPHLRYLDWGSGNGEIPRALLQAGASSVTALEPFGPDPGVPGVAWFSSADQLGAEYDVIFMVEVIEHLHAPADTLCEVRTMLAPGGCVVITTPNAGGLHARLRQGRWREVSNPTHLCLFSAAGLHRCLERAGLRITHRHTGRIDFGGRRARRLVGRFLQRTRLDGSLRVIAAAASHRPDHPSSSRALRAW